MTIDKSCPGSKGIRQPTPEYINCPDCGAEVEIWTDELKATCRMCGGKVFRAQQASCIDWCPHAKECIGPEVYERLRPGRQEEPEETSTLDALEREHDRALEVLGLLRGAALCLRLGTLKPGSPMVAKGADHLAKVLEFFEKDLKLHFLCEEEVLFPALDRHVDFTTSPTRLLLQEHIRIWECYGRLKEGLADLGTDGSEQYSAAIETIRDNSSNVEKLMREHIKRENEGLLPLAKGLLSNEELEDSAAKMRTLVHSA